MSSLGKGEFLRRGLELRQNVGYVRLVERGESEALLPEVVERRSDMDERRSVDDEESVVELRRFPDCE